MSQNPTNADILKEVRGIHSVLKDHEDRLKEIERYKTTQEAVANYVAKYGTPEQKEGSAQSESNNKYFAKIVLQLLTVFAAIIGLIYLIVQQFSSKGGGL